MKLNDLLPWKYSMLRKRQNWLRNFQLIQISGPLLKDLKEKRGEKKKKPHLTLLGPFQYLFYAWSNSYRRKASENRMHKKWNGSFKYPKAWESKNRKEDFSRIMFLNCIPFMCSLTSFPLAKRGKESFTPMEIIVLFIL